ncbi:MAG: hypothetical protein M3Z16_04860, partial [Pseudomonadota bacterium]|nr:hypothetical protein [Pseudomonadota bacterium]
MQTAFTRRDATTLKEQEREFTNEGAPPPGTVGTDLPALHVEGNDEVPAGEAAPVIVPQPQSVASLRHRVRVAEEERDSLSTFTQEEAYLRAS